MELLSAVAIFFIIWWVCLFAVLPWGVRTHADDLAKGSRQSFDPLISPSAPQKPLLWRKVGITTVVALVVWGVMVYLVSFSSLKLDDIPYLPKFDQVDYRAD